jgi:putative flavoprotein involved in K+ transport
VVIGVNGGYDVDVRQLAAGEARVIGRVAGASGGGLAIEANANQILDEADQVYADLLSAARNLAATGIHDDLAAEQPANQAAPAAISEVSSLDLAKENMRTIIWATGYTYDFSWVRLPVLDDRGRPVQRRGITQQPGLHFLGLHWMHTIKSGLLCGVGDDAEYLAEHIARTR